MPPRTVNIKGFIVAPSPSPNSNRSATSSEYTSIMVGVRLPEEIGDLDCQWLMDAAKDEFAKAGVDMRIVGLLPSSKSNKSSSASLPAAWMIDPSTKLDTMDLTSELEAVFMCDQLSVSSATGKATKIGASDFEFIRLLGEGATCKVFQVRRKKTGKMYAVKILSKDRIIGNHKKVEQALTERKVLVEVRHPFIVQLHWTFQTRSHLYFVLEFCAGGELFYHLSRRGRFDEEAAKFYFCEVLLGLEYLHNRNILYRDLKLENILLDEEGHVRLTDFGVSKLAQDNTKDQKFTSVVGTREYFSPEMIKREGHGKPYDFYCLGCVLYIMLTGSLPYFQGNWTEMYQKRVHGGVLQFPRGVPRLAMDLCARLLDRNPDTRIGSNGGAEEVRQHQWLTGVDWEKVYSKQVAPPIDPRKNADNFDPMFTQKAVPPQVIGIEGSGIASGPQSVIENTNKLPQWSFAEGLDRSRDGTR
jgi:serine/threonine protein kinase